MARHPVVTEAEWLEARKDLLRREKEFTRQRDQLSEKRRALPWVRVEKNYEFDTPRGRETLAQLFAGRSQLIVYHFMLGPDWKEPCKSCSFWADNFNGIDIHLAHRDVTLLAVSRAPLAKIEAVRKRMGWQFKWASSYGSDFNFDYHVSFTPKQIAAGKAVYNFELRENTMSELPGISVFCKDADTVYHSYSCYSRGLDMLNGAYHYLDIVPNGRDEGGLPYTMSWLRLHDAYAD